jgi:uncharacterized protein (DUF1697 family)
VQSGNVLLETAERSIPKLSERVEQAIESQLAFRPRVITRTVPEWRQVIAGNPFAGRNEMDPSRFLVTFLAAEPADDARHKVLAMNTAPEELHIRGRELYMYFPNGIGRPKTSPAAIEKALKVSGTSRNWNIVTKLLALAEQMEMART